MNTGTASETAHSSNPESVSKTTGGRFYYPELDGLRFFAFFLVFIHHHSFLDSFPKLTIIKTFGWVGVDLFFCLSSFLLIKLLLIENSNTGTINFRKFYLRRFFRIFPLLAIYVIVMFFVSISTFAGDEIKYTFTRLLGLLFFSDNLMSIWWGYNNLIYCSHLWTISYEEQFYFLLPFLTVYFSIHSQKQFSKLLLLSAVVFTIIRFLFIHFKLSNGTMWVLPITHFESIFLGLILGSGILEKQIDKVKPWAWVVIAVLFFYLLKFTPTFISESPGLMFVFPLAGIAVAALTLSVMHIKVINQIFKLPLLVFLGKRSFGLYVFHLASIGIVSYVDDLYKMNQNNSFVGFLAALVLTIILALLSYRFIETPFLKLKRRYELVATRPI